MSAEPLAASEEEEETPDRRECPEPETLERFMRLELSPEESRAVVRHLLTRCPQCRHITGQLWRHGSRKPIAAETLLQEKIRRLWQQTPPKPTRRKKAMAALIKAAQEMLLEIAQELRGIYRRLEGMAAALPPPDQQVDPEADDVATELRNVIRTVNAECLRSAIDDLRTVAYYPEEPPEEDGAGEPA